MNRLMDTIKKRLGKVRGQAVFLADLIRDTPAGQDDELTPFIIVRDIGDREAQPYVPVKALDKPPEEH